MLVTWNEPNDNGSPILGYWVERREINSSHWARVNRSETTSTNTRCILSDVWMTLMFPSVLILRNLVPDTELNVGGLLEGLTYIFRVAAENQAGPGKFSVPSEPQTAHAPICTYLWHLFVTVLHI